MNAHRRIVSTLERGMVRALAVLGLLLLGAQVARAGEIVPSVNLTRSVHGSTDTKASGGLALRGNLSPLFKTEIAASYRTEDRGSDLTLRQWPITASLYLSPVPMIYAGAGVGWYHTTFDYSSNVLFKDETKENFGVHLGGGFQVPVGPVASLDLGGRYVHMKKQERKLIPPKFDPDFWTTSLGLAIKF